MKPLVLCACLLLVGATVASASPPAAVTDFAVPNTGYSTAVATFTTTSGATQYEIRVWEQTMTWAGWGGYYLVKQGSCSGNQALCVVIDNLDDCHQWYWAVKLGNIDGWSGISNLVQKSTGCGPGEVDCP